VQPHPRGAGARPPQTRPDLRAIDGAPEVKLSTRDLSFWYGKFRALQGINLDIPKHRITALIGPSGCGKSTLLRVFNRMYDLVPGTHAEGSVRFDGEEILTTRNLLRLRQRIGMVFQRPSPFPLSIYDNVAYAPRLLGWKRSQID
jgi:phosphate transport system ATP-binding protein